MYGGPAHAQSERLPRLVGATGVPSSGHRSTSTQSTGRSPEPAQPPRTESPQSPGQSLPPLAQRLPAAVALRQIAISSARFSDRAKNGAPAPRRPIRRLVPVLWIKAQPTLQAARGRRHPSRVRISQPRSGKRWYRVIPRPSSRPKSDCAKVLKANATSTEITPDALGSGFDVKWR